MKNVEMGAICKKALTYIKDHPATTNKELTLALHGIYDNTKRRNTYTVCERLEKRKLIVKRRFIHCNKYWAVEVVE